MTPLRGRVPQPAFDILSDRASRAYFDAIEGWVQRFVLNDDPIMRANHEANLFEPYWAFFLETNNASRRNRVNQVVRPRGYGRRKRGTDMNLESVALALEPGGFASLGMQSLGGFAELRDAYRQSVERIQDAPPECFIEVNRAFVLGHRLLLEAKIRREYNRAVVHWLRHNTKSLDFFRYVVIHDLLQMHRSRWDLEEACALASALHEPWAVRAESRDPNTGGVIWYAGLIEQLAAAGLTDRARHLLTQAKLYCAKMDSGAQDTFLRRAEDVIDGLRRPRPQGRSEHAIHNLVRLGIIAPEKAAVAVSQFHTRRRVELDGHIAADALSARRARESMEAGIPTLTRGERPNSQHERFYAGFKSELDCGTFPKLFGNDYYLRRFIEEKVASTPRQRQHDLVGLIGTLADAYAHEECGVTVADVHVNLLYLAERVDDLFVGMNRYRREYGCDHSLMLNAHRLADVPIPGVAVWRMARCSIDRHARSQIELFEKHIDVLFAEKGNWTTRLFGRLAARIFDESEVFCGFIRDYADSNLMYPWVHCAERLDRCGPLVREITREANNRVREELSLPRIGEGWVSETTVFHHLRAAFSNVTVIQHGKPAWLGRQHLDIWIPEWGMAVEYHGLLDQSRTLAARRHFEMLWRGTREKPSCVRRTQRT